MNAQEKSILQSHARRLVPFDADLGAVITRHMALAEDLPPGNKGGDVIKGQIQRMIFAREAIQRAMSEISGALQVEAPDV